MSKKEEKKQLDNIVIFPVDNPRRLMPDRVDELVEEMKTEHVDQVAEHIMDMLMTSAITGGIDISKDVYDCDIIFVKEAIRSLLLHSHCIDHPFRKLVDMYVGVDDEGDFFLNEIKFVKKRKKKAPEEKTA